MSEPLDRTECPAVRIRVPASSANLGPGFDSVGLALGVWDDYDVVFERESCSATELSATRVQIEVTGEGAGQVPLDETHLVYTSMAYAWRRLGCPPPAGVRLVARNGVPHGRGLGSSASAIVAGVVAAQAYSQSQAWSAAASGDPVDVDLTVATDLATELEGHPDNASASVYGGLTISWTEDGRTHTAAVTLHPDLTAVVLLPTAQLPTSQARAVLPATVPHADAARDAGRAALLVEAMTRRPDLLLPATRDWLHQDYRRGSLGPSMTVVDALRASGHAAVISGAGPSVLVLTTRDRVAQVDLPAEAGDAGAWQRLAPGIPVGAGVSVTVR